MGHNGAHVGREVVRDYVEGSIEGGWGKGVGCAAVRGVSGEGVEWGGGCGEGVEA